MPARRSENDVSGVALMPEVRLFLTEMRIPAILATIGSSGGPVTSAVWYALDGERLIVSTPARGTKARRVDANPRVSLVVDTKERPYRGVAIEGMAEVADDPALAGWMRIAHRYLGPDLPEGFIERARNGPRSIIAITPLRARPWNLDGSRA